MYFTSLSFSFLICKMRANHSFNFPELRAFNEMILATTHGNCPIHVSLLRLSFLLLLSLALLTSSVTLEEFLSLSEPQMPHGVKWEESYPLPALL